MKKIILSVIILLITTALSAQKKVNFSEEFKKENQGKYKVEVNEVKELLIIMMSITDYGLGNDDMFEQKGDYYQRVLTHFKPYKDEPIIKIIDSLLQKSPLNYIFFSGNAQSYSFKNNILIPSAIYLLPADKVGGEEIKENPIKTYKKEIEDFAIKSKFHDFYKSEEPFYEYIISNYKKYADIGKQWTWLEKNFEAKVNGYIIYTSALINGLNYTGGYKNNDFHLIEMVLPTIDKKENRSEKESEAFNTRGMFTEIDHNYVGTPSEKHKSKINKALKDREKWVNTTTYGTKYYYDGVRSSI